VEDAGLPSRRRWEGVIDAPTWIFDYGFHPQMGEAIGAVTQRSHGILLGRTTTRCSSRPFFNDTSKYVVSLTRGPGPRLFPEDAAPSKLSLAACESYENGVVYLAYRPQT
jgi:hypothetical protein